MPQAHAPRIDQARLKSLLDGINQFGRNAQTGGYNRMGFSGADMAARRWLAEQMRAEGLAVHRDAAGNVFGRYGDSPRPCVMLGSHLDTVPEGGAFDGALGVAAALECLLALRDAELPLAHPVEVVATSEEEGRFGGMLGSQAMAGRLDRGWVRDAASAEGLRLWEAMTNHGLDPARLPEARRSPDSIKAFLELHIEQGPVLEASGTSIGVVDAVSGVVNWSLCFIGRANHSGTTPMDMRADAFAGVAEVAAAITEIVREHGSTHSRVTIGRLELQPNFPHTVPGQADFSLVIRDINAGVIDALCEALQGEIEAAARKHGLTWSKTEHSRLNPVALDRELVQLLKQEAEALGLSYQVLPSGAGHDAQTMQVLCPAGLIFVPSRNGISHAPEEWTDWTDISSGAQLLLNALTRLASPSG